MNGSQLFSCQTTWPLALPFAVIGSALQGVESDAPQGSEVLRRATLAGLVVILSE